MVLCRQEIAPTIKIGFLPYLSDKLPIHGITKSITIILIEFITSAV